MRGKGASGIVCDFVHGITPTCAGKSPAIMVCSLEYWGSPPRVWGKVQPERDVQDAARITPAYAGKSKRMRFPRTGSKDHPRVCGEKRSAFPVLPCGWGSPPRMRGKATERRAEVSKKGITPAYAGKSHLRTLLVLVILGSPPRMRGKVHLLWKTALQRGITPAYAGKRLHLLPLRLFREDHPRVCGEKRPWLPLLHRF